MIFKSITIIGAGNVAFHLCKSFVKAGYNISQLYSRNANKALQLSKELSAEAINNLHDIKNNADIYIIAVKDDAIESIARKLNLDNKIVAHTSGSIPLEILKQASSKNGIFYPLQTFKDKNTEIDFSNLPICITSDNEEVKKTLHLLAASISKEVYFIDEEQRLPLHIAAVFANNFSNYLLSISEDILNKEKLPFRLLLPLITSTLNKIKEHSPKNLQTGPAIRNDQETIKRHLNYLNQFNAYREVYKLITNNLLKQKKNEG